MKILGIETSCDETAAAVIQDGTRILSNVVASSADMHVKTGGIIPENAARQQVVSIIPVISQALSEAFGKRSSDYQLLAAKIDALAVTVGPGLIGSLLVGVETAKTLSYLWKKPIVPINHLTAHLHANWLTTERKPRLPKFPAVALVVSGGHTDLVFMKDHNDIKWIGGSRDDAAGEAFDKCARLLGLPYPGGPSIAKHADTFLSIQPASSDRNLNMFPRPMINEDNFDFSFSGLKTAVLRTVQTNNKPKHNISKIAANIQEAIVDVLVAKTLHAVKQYKPKSLLIAGGVAANKRLRESFLRNIEADSINVSVHVPPPNLCTDNAAHIASCAFFSYKPVSWKKINAKPQLAIDQT